MQGRTGNDEWFLDLAERCARQGTCFAKGTKICTPNGNKNVQSLKSGNLVYSYGLEGKLYTDVVKNPFSKIDECVRISTYNSSIVVSKDQLLFSKSGWKTASSFKLDDKIKVPSICDSNGITDWMIIGCLHGDGFLGTPTQNMRKGKVNGVQKAIYICVHPKSDDFWIKDWFSKHTKNKINITERYVVSKIASGVSKSIYVKDNLLWNYFFEKGCPVGRKKGVIKLNIKEMTDDDCRDFLTGIFSSEGSITYRKSTKRSSIVRLQLSMNWKECVSFIALLLERMKIKYVFHKYGKSYCITIGSAGEINKAVKCFDFRMDSRKQARYIILKSALFDAQINLKTKIRVFNAIKLKKDCGGPYYSEMREKQNEYKFDMENLLKFNRLPKLKICEIDWDCDSSSAYIPIKNIKVSKSQMVYDFSVEHLEHCVIANGIVAHNCQRRNYGAIIVDKDGTIISTGYSGSPKGQRHCGEYGECWREKNNIPSGSNYNKCLRGSTVIKLLDGTYKTIKELAESGEDNFWVYSLDTKTGKVIPSIAIKPRVTKQTKNFVRIKFRKDKEIECTPDHLLLLKNGTYKEASKLRVGDSLMPMYFNPNGINKIYETIRTSVNGWQCRYRKNEDIPDFDSFPTHRLVYEFVNGVELSKDQVVHHIDKNTKNNIPKNLRLETFSSHSYLHVEDVRNMPEESRKRQHEGVLKGARKSRERMLSDPSFREFKSKIGKKSMTNNWNSDKFRTLMKPVQIRLGQRASAETNSDKEIVEKRNVGRILKGIAFLDAVSGGILNKDNYEEIKSCNLVATKSGQKGSRPPNVDNILRHFSSVQKAIEESRVYNHCVIEIEFFETEQEESVYDLTVPGTENFAVYLNNNSCIFVHNCRSVHSEMNALLQAGKSARGSIMYIAGIDAKTGEVVPGHPCFLCSKMMVNAGISYVCIRLPDGESVIEYPADLFKKGEEKELGKLVEQKWVLTKDDCGEVPH